MPPHILRRPNPRIADIDCTRLQFQPGDRILVRMYCKTGEEQRKRLTKSIKKWAGTDIEVFIYDATQMEMTVERAGKIQESH